ncbi:MAG: Rrf2 family transcriptional regulator [Gemmatimonadaceae bacterium]|jgi:Rrf2 family protein|nr:Rrf2 family transcriptional regulator [Gemmatimonadaceae bacterium]
MLSQTAEYALRVVTYLAQQPPDEAVPAIAMASKVRVPRNYLSKILHQLAREGLLVSVRGRSGGFRLARAPEKIRLADVVTAFEPTAIVRSCILGRARCSESSPCGAHDEWKRVVQARDRFLLDTVVADVVR